MPHHSIVSTQVNHQPEVRDEYVLPMQREHLYLEREPLVEHNIHRSGVSLYGRDPALSALRPSGMHGAGPLLTQVCLASSIFMYPLFFHMFGLITICGLAFPKSCCGICIPSTNLFRYNIIVVCKQALIFVYIELLLIRTNAMQITQTMQIPLTYAEDIIGVKGANIAYIRANSGAVVTIQESLGSPDDITVEIKGTSSQVQAAQQLIQVIAHHAFFS